MIIFYSSRDWVVLPPATVTAGLFTRPSVLQHKSRGSLEFLFSVLLRAGTGESRTEALAAAVLNRLLRCNDQRSQAGERLGQF